MWFDERMGIKQIITDDLTGETLADGIKPTSVRVDGDDFEVFLSDESKETFLAFLRGEAPLLEVQRRATPARRRSKSTSSGYSAADVRAWAKQNGLDVPDRGRIPLDVMTAYNDRDK